MRKKESRNCEPNIWGKEEKYIDVKLLVQSALKTTEKVMFRPRIRNLRLERYGNMLKNVMKCDKKFGRNKKNAMKERSSSAFWLVKGSVVSSVPMLRCRMVPKARTLIPLLHARLIFWCNSMGVPVLIARRQSNGNPKSEASTFRMRCLWCILHPQK